MLHHRMSARSRQRRLEKNLKLMWARLDVELLEGRCLLSTGLAVTNYTVVTHGDDLAAPYGSPGVVGLTPAQIRHAYGFDNITFGSVTGDGSGQTIAIVDAQDNPKFVSSSNSSFSTSDLHNFDTTFGIPDPPSFLKVNQSGGTSYPTGDTGWGTEIALDVEWAHSLAPGANIMLVEATSASYANLFAAVNYAKGVTGVSVVSMSFGGGEFSGETSYDSTFTSPASHGVSFVASTGDSGAPGGYPAYSPRVVAIGGTTLLQNSSGYISEAGWSGSGGGISTTESKPSYQTPLVTQSSTRRTIPDVSFDADPNSGVAVYDSYSQGSGAPWIQVGGTSLSAPSWAGLLGVANQGRALAGQGSLDSLSQTLPKLYTLPAADFHDVTGGSNGNPAGTGYDLVTGRGSPVANLVAPGLIDGTPPPPTSGAHVTGSTASTSSTVVTFNEAVNPTTFDSSDVVFTGPSGSLSISGVTPVSGSGNTQFTISYATQTAVGTYTLVIGPNILDGAGLQMDQNQNGTSGEATDTYSTSFTISSSNTYHYSATDLPQAIRDFTETDSAVTVPSDIAITKLQVQLNITHTYDSDIRMYLVAPSGNYINLEYHRGGSGRNFTNTIFDDAASSSITSGKAPFNGTYRPEQALSAFNGKDAKGTWYLAVIDDYRLDQGTLNSWTLTITGTSGSGTGPAVVVVGSGDTTGVTGMGGNTSDGLGLKLADYYGGFFLAGSSSSYSANPSDFGSHESSHAWQSTPVASPAAAFTTMQRDTLTLSAGAGAEQAVEGDADAALDGAFAALAREAFFELS